MKRSKLPSVARCSMKGRCFSPSCRDIVGIQPFGQVRVDLEGAALPDPADRVGQVEVELGPVEGAVARFERVVAADALRSPVRSAFST